MGGAIAVIYEPWFKNGEQNSLPIVNPGIHFVLVNPGIHFVLSTIYSPYASASRHGYTHTHTHTHTLYSKVVL